MEVLYLAIGVAMLAFLSQRAGQGAVNEWMCIKWLCMQERRPHLVTQRLVLLGRLLRMPH